MFQSLNHLNHSSITLNKVINLNQTLITKTLKTYNIKNKILSSYNLNNVYQKSYYTTSQKPELDTTAFKNFLGLSTLKPGEVLKLNRNELQALITTKDKNVIQAMYNHAESISRRYFDNKVYLRGIVEFSNECEKNCKYCGVRRSVKNVKRYCMSKEDILYCSDVIYNNGYGTMMLQSGEITNPKRIDWLEDLIKSIKIRSRKLESKRFNRPLSECKGLQIALSVGELSSEYYQRLYDAGARRYLLRIETSNPKLYAKLHPKDHHWEVRHQCLLDLKRIGYQTGTGILIGVPYQTSWDLADDILYLDKLGADMIGMGPYVYQPHTPIGNYWKWTTGRKIKNEKDQEDYNNYLIDLTIRVYALTRIVVGMANIAATTALEALSSTAREKALQSGCNLVMPIITPDEYRKEYALYTGKSEVVSHREKLVKLINKINKEPIFFEWGDPLPHTLRHQNNN
ncbi:radical SAM enzyme [Anaeromyces robustus]|uniref:Radical SAM enzyme n=1 Tax=Anaeromyces robustus TaxID=1754192 RepID=A0A1Y1X8U3_9FUNG|nr:radical SAM enzyme [Anaeromyces robustus]|eukprot:ORX82185.1 radical SAM enzyme [Anaeromyces robustus]